MAQWLKWNLQQEPTEKESLELRKWTPGKVAADFAPQSIVFADKDGDIIRMPVTDPVARRFRAMFDAQYIQKSEHDSRVSRLLEANSREVERRRAVETEIELLRLQLRAVTEQSAREARSANEDRITAMQSSAEGCRRRVTEVMARLTEDIARGLKVGNQMVTLMGRLTTARVFDPFHEEVPSASKDRAARTQ